MYAAVRPRPRLARSCLAAMLACVAMLSAWSQFDFEGYQELFREDGPVETLTVIGLLAAAYVVAARYFEFRRGQRRAWRVVTAATALLLLFAAGEELSWGQRLHGHFYYSDLTKYNSQRETNLHNLVVGGVKLNKLVFTYLLGAAIALYFTLVPYLAARRPRVRAWLTSVGVPVPTAEAGVALLAGAVGTELLPGVRTSEALELLVPFAALAVLLRAGAVRSDARCRRGEGVADLPACRAPRRRVRRRPAEAGS